jgi:hypothetical protein
METSATNKRLSPRKQSWIAIGIPYAVFAIAVALLPIHLALIPVAIAVLGAGVFRMLQRCPVCGVSLARARIDLLGLKVQVYTPIAPRKCSNGHRLDGLSVEASEADVEASSDPT